jgi:hypothetical protein
MSKWGKVDYVYDIGTLSFSYFNSVKNSRASCRFYTSSHGINGTMEQLGL